MQRVFKNDCNTVITKLNITNQNIQENNLHSSYLLHKCPKGMMRLIILSVLYKDIYPGFDVIIYRKGVDNDHINIHLICRYK